MVLSSLTSLLPPLKLKTFILSTPALSNYPSATCISLRVTLHCYKGNNIICRECTWICLNTIIYLLHPYCSLSSVSWHTSIYYPLKTVSQGQCKRNSTFLFMWSTGQWRSHRHLCHKWCIQEKMLAATSIASNSLLWKEPIQFPLFHLNPILKSYEAIKVFWVDFLP